MANLRIIHDNAAGRAVLQASSTAGGLIATNTLTELKGQIHRSVGTSVTYTLAWSNPEQIQAVALPATNLSLSSTIRVRLYSDAAGTSLVTDTGVVPACQVAPKLPWNMTVFNANAFAYGGYTKTAVYFPVPHAARRCVIDIVDSTNPAGYIDCARLVVGAYWSPEKNAGYGAQFSLVDNSVASRNDAGDVLVELQPRHETMSFSINEMYEADRNALMQIIRSVGVSRNILVSLLPESDNAQSEVEGLIYGKRANSPFSLDYYRAYSHKVDIEGW